jgi:DNA-binding SARP family transcriptional activator/tetratricopeptide (TPR) repeat protein
VPVVQLRVLGPVEVLADDGRVLSLPRRQERALLGILLLAGDRTLSIERLSELLWEGDPPEQARQAIRTYVARIRGLLAEAGAVAHGVALLADSGGYRLKVPPEAVDALIFRTLFERAGRTADLAERDQLWRDALALWRGPALHNAGSDQLRHRLCADLDELRMHAVEESLATGLALGRDRELLPELARLVAENPVRERLVELHMRALYRHGRTAEALDSYRNARTRLAEEIGLDPGPALQELHRAMLRGEPLGDGREPSRPVRPAQLPSDLAAFAGRGDELDRLDTLLSGNATAVVIWAIAGTAGVGKTALAVHWAHRVSERFPDGQLYANLRGFDPTGRTSSATEVIRAFLDALGVTPQRIPTGLDAQIGLYRSLVAGKRILVLLDNARDSEQVRPLLPGTPGCLVLVTSRNQLTGLVAVDGAQPLALDLLTTDEARRLLAARLGHDRVAAEPEAVDDLIALCARLPLALAIAAAHAAAGPALSLAELAAELRHTRSTLDTLSGDDPATDLRAVFSWSHNALRPAAARLFRLLGLHPGPDIGMPAAASLAGVPLAEARQYLTQLVGAHLLTERAPGRYAFHDLLRAYATELGESQDSDADRREALHRLLDHYVHTAHRAAVRVEPHRDAIALGSPSPGVHIEQFTGSGPALAWFADEHSVLLAAVDRAADGFDRYAWHLAWTMVDFFDLRGHWYDWVSTQQVAVETAQRSGDGAALARAHRSLGYVYIRLGRLPEAQTHLHQAMDWYARTGDRAGHASVHLNLALVSERQERYTEAVDHAREALELYRAAGERRGQAHALNAVGWFQARLGDFRQALIDCQAALPLAQEVGDRRGEAATWDSLGYVHHHLGDHDQAVACYRTALDLYREVAERFGEADTLTRLGDTYQAAGEPDAAGDSWHEALDILDDLDHPAAETVRARLDAR